MTQEEIDELTRKNEEWLWEVDAARMVALLDEIEAEEREVEQAINLTEWVH